MTAPELLPPAQPEEPRPQQIGRIALGSMLIFAGISHLTFARKAFRAQVPPWLPLNTDDVVIESGIAEIALGSAIVGLPKSRAELGWVTAGFFAAVFPGNIAQYKHHRKAFGLDSDTKRLARLFFQPIFIGLALWTMGSLRRKKQ